MCDPHPSKTLASFLLSVRCRCLAQRNTVGQLRVPGTKQNNMVWGCHIHAGKHTYTQQVTIKERLCVNEPPRPPQSTWSEVGLPVSILSIVALLLGDSVVVVKSKNITAECRHMLILKGVADVLVLQVNNASNHPFPQILLHSGHSWEKCLWRYISHILLHIKALLCNYQQMCLTLKKHKFTKVWNTIVKHYYNLK